MESPQQQAPVPDLATIDSSSDLFPLALLMDELKHDEVSNRVEAMQKLKIISQALGPQRTRDELIPFLIDVAQDDEDEVFVVLAEQLNDTFIPFIGGVEYAKFLLPPLEILASTEETLVRNKAVDSLNHVASKMTREQILNDFIPLVEHLSLTEWFSSKCSACGLFLKCFQKLQDKVLNEDLQLKKKLFEFYYNLCIDDTPMVRRSAAKSLPEIIDFLSEGHSSEQTNDVSLDIDLKFISSMFEKVIGDLQDSVKFLAVDILISILKFFNNLNNYQHFEDLLSSAINLGNDQGWRIRYMVADNINKIAEQFFIVNNGENSEYLNKLIPMFINLTNDQENDVRKASGKQIPEFCEFLIKAKLGTSELNLNSSSTNETKVSESSESNKERYFILDEFFPILEKLSVDENEQVRISLASKITYMAKIMDREDCVYRLVPILIAMLKDESPDVPLQIISHLENVNEVVGIEILKENLLPCIQELSIDLNWRVRLAVIENIPILAKQLKLEIFQDKLNLMCLNFLWDNVYSIRSAAITNLKKLCEIFGSDWANEEIIKKLLQSKSDILQVFTFRITLLQALTELISVVSNDIILEQILPFIEHLNDDKVPNIRFNVAKAYYVVVKKLGKKDYSNLISNSILPKLKKLIEDEDPDVRYFANDSFNKIESL
ncbi:ARM repeat-containing protein [Hanseniaspora valbyensis NRRL Y-1626]|uniref:ARM repeat-containing protein n=1 Tax=Hanseniaspora valbyensis NRRL Y-1626 TaxID=766949 RepID=A0A1B7TDD8_9ASCO|nr:ARM repeat-containing protein [Hanseniaspora valbyensis NRRL Y-1626]